MRRKVGLCFILAGVLCIAGAMALLVYNRHEDTVAEAEAASFLELVKTEAEERALERADSGETVDPYDPEMTVVEIDGYSYIGYLLIPELGLELPVMSSYQYAYLNVSPTRYSGSTKSSDLVICGHNYTSHFGTLKYLSTGDIIYFVDMDGLTWSYSVAALEILEPTAIDEMTDSGYALTLFTCTYSGTTRLAVRCIALSD